MMVYESPKVVELGSVADVTCGAGSGPSFDAIFDILEGIKSGTFEWGAPRAS